MERAEFYYKSAMEQYQKQLVKEKLRVEKKIKKVAKAGCFDIEVYVPLSCAEDIATWLSAIGFCTSIAPSWEFATDWSLKRLKRVEVSWRQQNETN